MVARKCHKHDSRPSDLVSHLCFCFCAGECASRGEEKSPNPNRPTVPSRRPWPPLMQTTDASRRSTSLQYSPRTTTAVISISLILPLIQASFCFHSISPHAGCLGMDVSALTETETRERHSSLARERFSPSTLSLPCAAAAAAAADDDDDKGGVAARWILLTLSASLAASVSRCLSPPPSSVSPTRFFGGELFSRTKCHRHIYVLSPQLSIISRTFSTLQGNFHSYMYRKMLLKPPRTPIFLHGCQVLSLTVNTFCVCLSLSPSLPLSVGVA